MGFVGSYIWKLRQVLGTQKIIMAGVGLIVTDEAGRIWMGKRSDSGEWSYFGGSVELDASVMDTVRTEMLEETGIETQEKDWTFVGIHSLPKETYYRYPNGDEVQVINHLFTMRLDGSLGEGDDEHTEFALFDLDKLPTPMKPDTALSLEVYRAFLATGKAVVR